MNVIQDRALSSAVLFEALAATTTGELRVEVEGATPSVPALGKLIGGASTPMAQRRRLLEALSTALTSEGLPPELVAKAIERVRQVDGPAQSAALKEIQAGFAALLGSVSFHRKHLRTNLHDAVLSVLGTHGSCLEALGRFQTEARKFAVEASVSKDLLSSELRAVFLEMIATCPPDVGRFCLDLADAHELGLGKVPSGELAPALRAGFIAYRGLPGAYWHVDEALKLYGSAMSNKEKQALLTRAFLRHIEVFGPAAPELQAPPFCEQLDLAQISPKDLRDAVARCNFYKISVNNGYCFPDRASWLAPIAAAVDDEVVASGLRRMVEELHRRSGYQLEIKFMVAQQPELGDRLDQMCIAGISLSELFDRAQLPKVLADRIQAIFQDTFTAAFRPEDVCTFIALFSRTLSESDFPAGAITIEQISEGIERLTAVVRGLQIPLTPPAWWDQAW